MSTENILLNSPALKSLKRAQLVGLCKRCGLRANGKNTELIARLEEYGRSGGTVDVLGDRDDTNRLEDRAESVAETNDGDGNDKEAPGLQSSTRPTFVSRAWPVGEPMGVEANIPGAPSVNHEFGDGDAESKKSSSVSSSFKLLAASLFGGSSARSKASTPPSVVEPEPTFVPDTTPKANCDGPDVEMEPNTSISTVLKEEIDVGAPTVRLVAPSKNPRNDSPPTSPEYANPSPFKGRSLPGLPSSSSQLHLLPFASSSSAKFLSSSTSHNFSKSTPPELMMGSPDSKPLYPSLNSTAPSLKTMTSDSFSIPGTFPDPPAHPYPAYLASSPKAPEPTGILTNMNPDFTFRSPLPKVADPGKEQGSAKAAVLAEMRRRMMEEPSSSVNAAPGGFSFAAVPAPADGAKKRGREEEISDAREGSSASHAAKFDKAHRKQFDKMASIADHYAARRPRALSSPRKSNANGRPSSTNGYPRARMSIIGNRAGRRPSSAAARLSVAKAATNPSALNPDERPGKRARISSPSAEEASTEPKPMVVGSAPAPSSLHVQISAPANGNENVDRVDLTAETKRKVEAASANARARRKSRSSLGRQSLSRNAVLGNHPPPKPKSRFGFLKSSAKLVKSVYTSVMGGGATESRAASTKNDASSVKSKKTFPATTRAGTTVQSPGPARAKPQLATQRPSHQTPAPLPRPISKAASPSSGGTPRDIARKASSSSRPGISPMKPERAPARALPVPPASTNSISSRLRTFSVGATSTLRSEMSPTTAGTTPASSIGFKRANSVRSSNNFAAPTISSLARASAKAKSLEQAQVQSGIRPSSIGSRMALLASVPEQHQQQAATTQRTPRGGAASPNKFGFVSKTSSSPKKPITTPRFMLSPPNSALTVNTHPAPQSPTTPTMPLYEAALQVVGPPAHDQNNDTVILSPRENVSLSVLRGDAGGAAADGLQASARVLPTPLLPRSTSNASSVRTSSSNLSLRKRPRISRSKVIAKLDQKRAADDAGGVMPPSSIRFKPRTRSSIGVGRAGVGLDPKVTASRRSYVTSGATGPSRRTSGLARKERAVLESFQRGQRKNEAAARLKRSSQAPAPMPRVIAEQGEDE